MDHYCPVRGFVGLEHAPRSAEGGGSYEICPSCGFQFGVDDDDRGVSAQAWRERWVRGGMKWASRGISPPSDWDPARQLSALKAKPGGKAQSRGGRRK